ncbi:MAG: hypothetical protein LUH07_11225 [Lachnospiraceae bacterium]|nr:hypothetical protein [Lachnospiraceae bacterium]
MKKKRIRITGLAGSILAVLLSAGSYVYAEESADMSQFVLPTGDLAVREPSDPMEMLSPSDTEELEEQMSAYTPQYSGLLINNASVFYYYENLDPIAKEIYDVLYSVAQDPVSWGNVGLIMTDMDPSSDEYYYEFNLAYRAICFDHPELFWLYSGEEAAMVYGSEAISQNGFYFVYIMMQESYVDFEEDMQAFNSAVDAFLADIDTGISEYETIRQIHDKLIALVNYNDPVISQISTLSNGQDLAHTAYGALVADSSGIANYAVCDGYTLAFEYLLQQCGIEAVFIGGNAGTSEEDAGGHAWNIVKMDGEWYEVDCTWDDAGSLEDDLTPGTLQYDYIMEALNDEIYREKIDHYLFLVSTDEITHFEPGDEYDYITKDQHYSFQLTQESVHIRFEDDGMNTNLDSAIISLAPIAINSYQPGE